MLGLSESNLFTASLLNVQHKKGIVGIRGIGRQVRLGKALKGILLLSG